MLRLRNAALAVGAALTLGACVVAPLGYDAYGYDTPVALADVPPPAPYYEVRPALPFAGALWISGYWGWHGGRHQWVPGRWDHPRAGHVWRPYAWQPHGGRWALRGGWARGR